MLNLHLFCEQTLFFLNPLIDSYLCYFLNTYPIVLVDYEGTCFYINSVPLYISATGINATWHKPKVKPYFHQISLDYIEKRVKRLERINIEEKDCDIALRYRKY